MVKIPQLVKPVNPSLPGTCTQVGPAHPVTRTTPKGSMVHHDSIDGDMLHPGNKKHAGDSIHSKRAIGHRRHSFSHSPTPAFFFSSIGAVDRTIESGEWDATYTTAYALTMSPPYYGRFYRFYW